MINGCLIQKCQFQVTRVYHANPANFNNILFIIHYHKYI